MVGMAQLRMYLDADDGMSDVARLAMGPILLHALRSARLQRTVAAAHSVGLYTDLRQHHG